MKSEDGIGIGIDGRRLKTGPSSASALLSGMHRRQLPQPTPPLYTPDDGWIRGVNIGGWLLAERYITPYLFAVNSCHLEGELCWYPGQVGMPDDAVLCDPNDCEPVLTVPTTDGNNDFHPLDSNSYVTYPIDEMTLGRAFLTADASDCTLDQRESIARSYMERHWDTFVTKQDLVRLRDAGVTHLRVPMGYWIRGDVVREGPDTAREYYIPGGWPYFVRLVKWCREIGNLTVWADLHGAPGSQNGFDNSGQYNPGRSTCVGWFSDPRNVERTAAILQDIASAIADEGLTDVVKGFGVLNEPFLDCDLVILRRYYNRAFDIVRSTMGNDTAIFVGDMFRASLFEDGFWADNSTHHNTYLDTHSYQVFFERGRALTPRQHIAYTCRHSFREVDSCCYYRDGSPVEGISRIIGEWSAAFDQLPTALTPYIMKYIAANGTAPLLDRTIDGDRRVFVEQYVKAQMATYESAETGVSSGWLFWNFKMEGGAFAEWDFLRGVREGWIPKFPDPTVPMQSLYGSCMDILNRTTVTKDAVVNEYPDPRTLDWNQWQGWNIDDDFVNDVGDYDEAGSSRYNLAMPVVVLGTLFPILLLMRWIRRPNRNESYTQLK